MIDHVLGRPSSKFRKLQVFAVVSFWTTYLLRGNPNGPPLLRRVSERIGKRLTAWQTVVLTMLWLYLCRNFAKITGLASPEPLANLYTRSYFRATWIMTALDAGFWTAMPITNKALRDIASIAFSVFYIFAAEQADEKVRKVRSVLTVDHLRVSWNKGTAPYLSTLNALLRPKFCKYPPRKIQLQRPSGSSYREPIEAWLYYDGPLSDLVEHDKLILDVPGGGFVAMTPRNHDDKLLAWAGKLKIPVLSLDYGKAPEYPYPYALNEVFDAYSTIIQSRGKCIGLSGQWIPRIVMTADSAGGSLATGAVLMMLQAAAINSRRSAKEKHRSLPIPEGLILVYPGLDMNIGNWMTDEQMGLIQDRCTRKTNARVLRRKSEDYYKLDPKTPHGSDDERENGFLRRTHTAVRLTSSTKVFDEQAVVDEPVSIEDVATSSDTGELIRKSSRSSAEQDGTLQARREMEAGKSQSLAEFEVGKPKPLQTRLAVSSMISYFNDRILTPEMMRSMIILYIGPHNRPDFATDFLLSPVLAPDNLLAKFPKVYFLTGERDPLVDDTVIMAGRLRAAKHAEWLASRELGLGHSSKEFDEREHVEVKLIEGISHGFMQFVGVYPQGWRYIFRCTEWARDIFQQHDEAAVTAHEEATDYQRRRNRADAHRAPKHHFRTATESSGDDEPLEMRNMMTKLRDSKEEREQQRPSKSRGHSHRTGRLDQRQKSSVSLASEDDLLGRRMNGLTGGLMGITRDD